MPRFLRACAVVLVGIAASTGNAQEPTANNGDDPSTHFARASEAFAAENYTLALTEFRAAIAAGSAGPAAYYNVAVSLYRLEDYAVAESAFRDLSNRFPSMRALADYNIGLSRVRQDDPETAREYFVRAAESDDAQVQTLALAMLSRLPVPETGARGRRAWLAQLELAVGNDDNVALIDPLGLPAGISAESPFSELTLYAGGPVGRGAWQVSASAFLLEYTDANEFDQHGFGLSSRYAPAKGRWRFALGPQFGQTYIGADGFERYLGATLEVRRPLARIQAEIELRLSYDDLEELESRFAYIAGDRSRIAVRVGKVIGAIRFEGEYRMTHEDRASAGIAADRDRIQIRFARAFGSHWSGDLTLESRDASYDRLIPTRDESRTQLGLRAVRRLPSEWQLSMQYWSASNDSTDEAFSYDRDRYSVGLSKLFR